MTDPFLNPMKTKLSAGQACIGAWLMSGSAINAEAMATLGFDWLCVDMEHGSTSISQIEAVFMAAERHGTAPLVRISSLDGDLARRLLDLGSAGIIVAAVEDAKDFEDFAYSCLYAPNGHRGMGLSRCNKWGDDFDAYKDTFQPVLVPMIETERGIEASAKLAALPMVDALFLGPYDLSTNLGCPGDLDNETFKAAIEQVRKACGDNAKAAGIHQVAPEEAELKARINEGFTMVAYGTDLLAMRSALEGIRKIRRRA